MSKKKLRKRIKRLSDALQHAEAQLNRQRAVDQVATMKRHRDAYAEGYERGRKAAWNEQGAGSRPAQLNAFDVIGPDGQLKTILSGSDSVAAIAYAYEHGWTPGRGVGTTIPGTEGHLKTVWTEGDPESECPTCGEPGYRALYDKHGQEDTSLGCPTCR